MTMDNYYALCIMPDRHLYWNNQMAKSFNITAEKSAKPPLRRLEALLERIRDPRIIRLA